MHVKITVQSPLDLLHSFGLLGLAKNQAVAWIAKRVQLKDCGAAVILGHAETFIWGDTQ